MTLKNDNEDWLEHKGSKTKKHYIERLKEQEAEKEIDEELSKDHNSN